MLTNSKGNTRAEQGRGRIELGKQYLAHSLSTCLPQERDMAGLHTPEVLVSKIRKPGTRYRRDHPDDLGKYHLRIKELREDFRNLYETLGDIEVCARYRRRSSLDDGVLARKPETKPEPPVAYVISLPAQWKSNLSQNARGSSFATLLCLPLPVTRTWARYFIKHELFHWLHVPYRARLSCFYQGISECCALPVDIRKALHQLSFV